MGGHKFHGDLARLDSPKRQEIFPIETLIEAVGDTEDNIAVADLGCGIGYLAIPLAKHLNSRGIVYAVDISPDMLAVLKERIDGFNNIEVLKSEENSFPIPNGTIDISYMLTVFHELDDPDKFLMEIRRVSKPFHRIIVVDWNQTPGEMGPPLHERIPEDEAVGFFKKRGYALIKKFVPSKYAYGLVFVIPTCKPLDRVWS